VTAFIDNHQTNMVVKEYLKDEKGLKRTEQLLRNILERDTESSLLPRLEAVLREKGISEGDLEQLLSRITTAPVPAENPKKKRTRRPRAPRPVVEKIEKALADGLSGKKPVDEVTAYLAGVFKRETSGRTKNAEAARVRLEEDLGRVEGLLGAVGLSLAAFDPQGRVVLATGRAVEILQSGPEGAIPEELLEYLRSTGDEGDGPARSKFLSELPPEQHEKTRQILEAVDRTVRDDQGNLLGLILHD
jgi:hypothetical protein